MDETNGLIEELLTKNLKLNDTKFLLTNAIYFKGLWEEPFSKSATSNEEFTKASGDKKTVKMMRSQRRIEFAERGDYEVVSLDYKNSSVSMAILLPKSGKSIADIESSLTASEWREALEGLNWEDVQLGVPRFTLRHKMQDAKSILKSFGLGDLFEGAASPLKKISAGEPGLFVAGVEHEAVMIVDEDGTEAAAVTVIQGFATAKPNEQAREFLVNRPALVILYEKTSGGMLFFGSIGDPDSK